MHATSATSQGRKGQYPTLLLTLPPSAGRLDPNAAACRLSDMLVANDQKNLKVPCLSQPTTALMQPPSSPNCPSTA